MVGAEVNAELAGRIRIGDFFLNRLGFGAMRITGAGIWGPPKDRRSAIRLLRRAAELGVNFIDTADAYGPEVSENLIAEALFPYRGMIIATKGGMTRSGPGIWVPDCSATHLREACEASLKRLRIDTIDLYQLHTVDPKVPFEDSFGTLVDLQREGKIRYIGLSNIEPHHFMRALNIGSFVSVQNRYNLLNREHEDILRLCKQHRIVFIPYYPIGGSGQRREPEALIEISHRLRSTTRQVELAWLLSHATNILPIPGTSSVAHLEENLASADIDLDSDDLELLDELAADTT